ncbi:hypothetical protein GQF61_15705 [Sphingobacterium sp. DK4209]|uniref:Beta-carotene 15,15'-monooxygenase n=1 Tax=Sphingobacterium zhuxiongii TaxID=2662364 RepID=A0A5Q0Q7F5_9SPHI|nr:MULTISPECIES: hypothetical protein [unclassified Sphingobacterium]MVZ67302.1 hypothetical protein [Sphingobacterium sp. DK4209]QGA25039.1 hypothetical protein GFH32_01295 [Sphingobacterium sp. dk4302]
MDELDFLKQHWKKDDDFPKVDKEGIRKMLHNSSSSIVKWIFYISLIELFVGLALNFFIPSDSNSEFDSELFTLFEYILSGIFYIIVAYFIFKFFSAYRSIKNTNNTKVLLHDILETRKAVDQYIRFNIYYISFISVLVTISMFFEDHIFERSWGEALFMVIAISIVMLLVMLVFLWIVKLYYKLLYRRLVNKLNKNYEELVKLDEEE